jgi:non-specific serine/threonine protein kinase/serine/threonine-protein kinase
MSAAMPERVAGYKISKVLGQGGMGVVYLAKREDSSFAPLVALKVIKRGMDTEDIVRRFETERKVLSGLNHPNIARLIDGGTTEEGLPFFALEYIEGVPLDKYCDSNRLSTRDRLVLFQKICAAVHYAHQNLIVHRDLKPGNILVSTQGEPKLLDFGIAKLLNPSLFEISEVTGPGMRLMTPEYASPEQVRGDPITTASDVYSLGVILYELLTGRRPYKFKTRLQHEIVRIVCEEEPAKPSTVVSFEEAKPSDPQPPSDAQSSKLMAEMREGGVDRLRKRLRGDIDDIVLKSLDKSPQRRYTSAEQLAEDLSRHLDGQPVVARPASVAYKFEKFVRRNRGSVAAACAVFVALAGGVIGTTYQWQAAVAAEQVAVQERNVADEQRQKAEAATAEANAQREKAQNAWNEVWTLSTRFIDQFHQSVIKLPGSIPARELLVNTANEYMDKLLANSAEDMDKQLTASAIFERMGQVQADMRGGSKGDAAQGLVLQRRALEIREKVLAARPDDRVALLAAGSSHLRIGDLLSLSGQQDESVKSYEAALPLLKKLDGESKDAVPALMRIAAIESKLGDAARRSRDLPAAEKHYEEAQRVRTRVAALDPGATAKRNLSVGLLDIAGLFDEQGKHDAAIERIDAAIAVRRELLAAEPEQARTQRDLAVALRQRASSLLLAGRAADGEAAVREARGLMSSLVEKEKQSPDARNVYTLAMCDILLGDVLSDVKKHAEAASAYASAAATLGPITQDSKETAEYRRGLADALGGRGAALLAQGDAAEALASLERSRDVLDEILKGSPDDGELQRSLLSKLARSAGAAEALAKDQRESMASRRRVATQGVAWAARGLAIAESLAKLPGAPLDSDFSPESLRDARDRLETLARELGEGTPAAKP